MNIYSDFIERVTFQILTQTCFIFFLSGLFGSAITLRRPTLKDLKTASPQMLCSAPHQGAPWEACCFYWYFIHDRWSGLPGYHSFEEFKIRKAKHFHKRQGIWGKTIPPRLSSLFPLLLGSPVTSVFTSEISSKSHFPFLQVKNNLSFTIAGYFWG